MVIMAAGTAAGCGPEETLEQRVSRQRGQYEIAPTAVQNVVGRDGSPAVAVDLLVVFQGNEPLEVLTLVLEIRDVEGSARAVRRFTIDTGHLVRGVSSQVSAHIPGLELGEGEHATVELEVAPPAGLQAEYPEYGAGVN